MRKSFRFHRPLFALAVAATAAVLAAPTPGTARSNFPLHPADAAARLGDRYLNARPIPAPRGPKRGHKLLPPKKAARIVAWLPSRRRRWNGPRPTANPDVTSYPGFAGDGGQSLPFDPSLLDLFTQGPRSVIPPGDTRVRVTPTTNYPDRPICKLYITRSDNAVFIGTGTLVAPNVVLTAGHCVYLHKDKPADPPSAFAKSIEVIPALDGPYKPYGSHQATAVFTFLGFVNDGNLDADFGVIRINSNIGNTTGFFGYETVADATIDAGLNGIIEGYPGDRAAGVHLYTDNGQMLAYTEHRFKYQIDTGGGQSGSAIYRIAPLVPGPGTGPYAFGVHTHGTSDLPPVPGSQNAGTRIEANKFGLITDVINGLNPPPAGP